MEVLFYGFGNHFKDIHFPSSFVVCEQRRLVAYGPVSDGVWRVRYEYDGRLQSLQLKGDCGKCSYQLL
jgi:hypothetical protein